MNEIYKSYKVEKALDKYNALMDFFKGELEEYNFEALRYVLEPYISCSLNLDGVAFEHLDKEIIKDKSEEQLNSFLDKLGEILAFYHLLNKNFFILNTERECELKKTSTQIIASNQSVIKEKAGQPLVPYLPTYDQPIFDKELIFSGLPIGLAFAKKCVEKPRR